MKRLWCRLAHRRIARPFKGKYDCLQCGLSWPVDWPATWQPRKAGVVELKRRMKA